jgi:uncharacterized MAPEG superfamily protein
MLLASTALFWALIMTGANARILTNGLGWALGNRDAQGGEDPQWLQRCRRAQENLQENLILFAIVVLTVHVAGKANDTSALGAQVFFGARVAHALLYIAGVPVVRTLAWAGGITGCAMSISTLF